MLAALGLGRVHRQSARTILRHLGAPASSLESKRLLAAIRFSLLAMRANREAALWAAMLTKMITIDESNNWIEVDSAFGGLAIYRRRALDGVIYSGLMRLVIRCANMSR